MKLDLVLLVHGREYEELFKQYYGLINENYYLHIICNSNTDVDFKDQFEKVKTVTYRDIHRFNYFNKLYETLKIGLTNTCPVVYMDVKRIPLFGRMNINNKAVEEFNNPLILGNWGPGINSAEKLIGHKSKYFEDGYWEEILNIFIRNGVSLDSIVPVLEQMIVFPSKIPHLKIYQELKLIEPFFISNVKRSVYKGIGNGEGLALGYVFAKLGIKTNSINLLKSNLI